jgi:ABC-type branched-subunit amino acid transport system substrate-binding protein
MTMWSLERLTGISEDSLTKLNPSLKDGLKAGSMIRIPDPDRVVIGRDKIGDTGVVNLVDSLKNFKSRRIALMLPFALARPEDSLTDAEFLEKSRVARLSLDFYSGVMVAVDSANRLGINILLDTYDTRRSKSHVSRLLASNDFKKYSAVIGPLIADNTALVAQELSTANVPVISPLTNSKVQSYDNLFQSRPLDEARQQKMVEYLSSIEELPDNVVIISDFKHQKLANALKAIYPSATVLMPNDKNYIYNTTITGALNMSKSNWVILTTDQETLVTVAVSSLAAKAVDTDLTVYAIDFDENKYHQIESKQLAAIQFTYPSVGTDDVTADQNSFFTNYESRYNVAASKYAVRGFDIAMDIILRMASAEDLYDSVLKNYKTSYVENSFNYAKRFMAGFYNEAVAILQYQQDLTLSVVSR